jgi:hypothetical protein
MKQQAASFAALLLLTLCGGGGHAFSPHHQSKQSHPVASSVSKSALSLIPGQGGQLVAAFNVASFKREVGPVSVDKKKSVDDSRASEGPPSSSSSHWRALASSRSFVARLFHIPSGVIRSHPHPDAEWVRPSTQHHHHPSSTFPHNFLPQNHRQHRQERADTVLYYPVVGFRFVPTVDGGRSMVLPTTSHAACRLRPLHERSEEVVGWYSPACKLDLYSEDPCHEPITNARRNSVEEEMNLVDLRRNQS